jgi:peroxiredoxin
LNSERFVFTERGREVRELFPTYDDTVTMGQLPLALEAKDLSGDLIDLKQLAGRPVVVVAFSVANAESRDELVRLKQVHQELSPKGLEVIAISTDPSDSEAAVRKFRDDQALPFPIVFDGKGLDTPFAAHYRLTAVPFRLIIGRNGRIFAINPKGIVLEATAKAATGT